MATPQQLPTVEGKQGRVLIRMGRVSRRLTGEQALHVAQHLISIGTTTLMLDKAELQHFRASVLDGLANDIRRGRQVKASSRNGKADRKG